MEQNIDSFEVKVLWRRYMTTEALARVARRAGVRREQERVREAWDKGLFVIRSPERQ